jgi:hypothetical protein
MIERSNTVWGAKFPHAALDKRSKLCWTDVRKWAALKRSENGSSDVRGGLSRVDETSALREEAFR